MSAFGTPQWCFEPVEQNRAQLALPATATSPTEGAGMEQIIEWAGRAPGYRGGLFASPAPGVDVHRASSLRHDCRRPPRAARLAGGAGRHARGDREDRGLLEARLLRARGRFTCLLINAAHLRHVPGRKTDVQDCAWIAQVLEHGLVRGASCHRLRPGAAGRGARRSLLETPRGRNVEASVYQVVAIRRPVALGVVKTRGAERLPGPGQARLGVVG
jgi:hypothetical protein